MAVCVLILCGQIGINTACCSTKAAILGKVDDAASWHALNHVLNYVDQVLFRVVMFSLFGKDFYEICDSLKGRTVTIICGRPLER